MTTPQSKTNDTYRTRDTSVRLKAEKDLPSPGPSLHRILGWVAAGAIGGAVFALIERFGPELLGRPELRWVFLYALLGSVTAGVWDATASWIAAWRLPSRRDAAVLFGLTAGILLGGATLLVGALETSTSTDTHFLLQLSWKNGLAGFVVGAAVGGLWRFSVGQPPARL